MIPDTLQPHGASNASGSKAPAGAVDTGSEAAAVAGIHHFGDEGELDAFLTRPSPELVRMMGGLDGDIAILGIGGKMGPTLGRLALRAADQSGKPRKVIGISRFGDEALRDDLEQAGIRTVACDLMDPASVASLPDAENVIYMAGRKFGTDGSEALTWAMNTCVPLDVSRRYKDSRIVVFSTGCVYPLATAESGGSREEDVPEPVGEYAQSCLGRERVFQYHAQALGTRVLLFRLNYSVDLRYGVLYDIGSRVWAGEPVPVSAGHFNVVWQGDACEYALRGLELSASPAAVLNVTGPETAGVVDTARKFGRIMGREPRFEGEPACGAYLSDAGKCFRLFGYPRVPLEQMIHWQARWIMDGGRALGKPTHFEVNDGKF